MAIAASFFIISLRHFFGALGNQEYTVREFNRSTHCASVNISINREETEIIRRIMLYIVLDGAGGDIAIIEIIDKFYIFGNRVLVFGFADSESDS